MKSPKNIYIITMTFLTMLLFAITDGARGILVPAYKATFGVSDSSIGILFTMSSFAYLIGSYIGSIICQKIGQKPVILAGIVIAGLGLFSASHTTAFWQLVICFVITNIGFSIMAMGMNTLIPLMPTLYLGVLMNLLHFFYGLGSTITQRATGLMLATGISWRNILFYFSMGYIIIFILYSLTTPPHKHVAKEPHESKIHHWRLLIIASISLAFYVAAEIQTANWLFNYYQLGLNIDTKTGSLYVSMFFAFFTAGRLFGGFVAEKIGYLRSVAFTMIISIILYTTGIILGTSGMLIIAISGLFFSIVFPTMILVIQQMFENSASRATGIATMITAIMTMSSGIGIGMSNDHFGVGVTIYFIPIALVISVLLIIPIKKYLSEYQIEIK